MSVPQVLRLGIFALPFAAVVAACGSRGPLDIGGPFEMDAGMEADLPDVSVPDTNPPPPPIPDAGKDSGPNPLNCGVCVVQNCGAPVLKCLQDMACRTVLTCVTQTCLASGKLDPACLLTCAGSDPSAAIEALQIVQCLTGKCGGDCGGILPGGLGGMQPGRIGGSGRVLDEGERRAMVDGAFSAWPELTSHSTTTK
jgi:hypothetical protein